MFLAAAAIGDLGCDASASEPTTMRPASFPPLVVPDERVKEQGDASFTWAGPLVTTGSALLVVLGVFGGLVFVSRTWGQSDRTPGALPSDVLDKLGTLAIDPKTRVMVFKWGDRILLVGQSAGGELNTLSEITDPEEVDRMTNRCLGRPEIVGRRSQPTPEQPMRHQPTRRASAG